MKMTKHQLFALMTSDGSPTIRLPNGRIGVVSSIEREDGSGRSFNLTVKVSKPPRIGNGGTLAGWTQSSETIHVRMID